MDVHLFLPAASLLPCVPKEIPAVVIALVAGLKLELPHAVVYMGFVAPARRIHPRLMSIVYSLGHGPGGFIHTRSQSFLLRRLQAQAAIAL